MNKNKTNQYRLKFSLAGTKSYPRSKAIELIAESLTFNRIVSPKQFDNKNLSAEHRKTLIESATLWNKLTKLENAVKERAKKPKTISNL